VAIALSLCGLIFTFQKLMFPNILLESNQRFLIEITPIDPVLEITDELSNRDGDDFQNVVTPIPGVFSIGMIIAVSGTGNDGLRIRSSAGIDQNTIGLAQEGEQFKLIEGPEIKDSLVWWKIIALNDSQKTGWSVQDYMKSN
jgi:hypothetical protein